MRYVYDNWAEGHGRYPSTGFLTLIFALHICDKVKVPFCLKRCVVRHQRGIAVAFEGVSVYTDYIVYKDLKVSE